jgi:hypothetical protein
MVALLRPGCENFGIRVVGETGTLLSVGEGSLGGVATVDGQCPRGRLRWEGGSDKTLLCTIELSKTGSMGLSVTCVVLSMLIVS